MNERDNLGDDLVPDYATSLTEGAWYGWPWYYMGKNEDPRLQGLRPDLAGQGHCSRRAFPGALGGDQHLLLHARAVAPSAFPKEYEGDAFAVLHGSWNRAFRTGHKIVRLPMKKDAAGLKTTATGQYIDFMTGFITADGNTWGRPVSLVELKDGSVLLGDDGANLVYRISYSKP